MKAIWKFTLPAMSGAMVEMPQGAAVLCVQSQGDVPMIWAEVDTEAPKIKRRFFTYGTGHEMPPMSDDPRHYIGTFQISGGALVFHVYTDRKEYSL